MALTNKLVSIFSYEAMQRVMAYLLSYNMATQALAIDGSAAEDIQTTGGADAILNGQVIKALAADAVYDISVELPYAAWAASTAYTIGGLLSEVTVDGRHFACILAHTSSATSSGALSNKPLYGDLWRTNWKELSRWALAGVGNSIAQDMVGWYLVCAMADGVLRVFKAYDGTATAATTPKIPVFDPERYIPIGMIRVAPTSGAHVLGTTALTTVGTYAQLVGPVFPDYDFLKKQQV